MILDLMHEENNINDEENENDDLREILTKIETETIDNTLKRDNLI